MIDRDQIIKDLRIKKLEEVRNFLDEYFNPHDIEDWLTSKRKSLFNILVRNSIENQINEYEDFCELWCEYDSILQAEYEIRKSVKKAIHNR